MSIRAIKPNRRTTATASGNGAKVTTRPVIVGEIKGTLTEIVQKGKPPVAPPWAAFQPTMNIDSIHERVEKRIAINRKKEA